jgi:hypothetical protein
VSALEQYRWHHPFQHVKKYPGNHWMLPSGNYSLHIAPAAARATANRTMMKKWPTLLAILVAVAVRKYNTARIPPWKWSRALVEATGHHHQASITANSSNWSRLMWMTTTPVRIVPARGNTISMLPPMQIPWGATQGICTRPYSRVQLGANH